jgi:hypothetical protein
MGLLRICGHLTTNIAAGLYIIKWLAKRKAVNLAANEDSPLLTCQLSA